MKRRGADENSPIIRFIVGIYKVKAISRKLMARLLGVRKESRGLEGRGEEE